MNAIAHASAAPVRGPKLDNRRVLAGIVDLAIVTLGAVVILFAGDALSSDGSEVRGALGAVILGWALYYYFALESGGGQTVGKKLMKLRVVRADGSPVGMREVAVRTVLRVIDGVGAYIVGLIVMLVTGEKRQRIGDLAAGTIVVDASAPSVVPAVATPVAEVEHAEAHAEAPEADEPEAEMPEADVPEAEADGDADAPATATITLPSRPEPPATLADLAAPEAPAVPAVPEMRPFPPVEEPAAEEPVEEEPVAEEPVAEEPVAEDSPAVGDPVTDEIVPVTVEPEIEEPVAEEPLPEIASPSIQELANDVAAAQAEPVEDVVEAEPVVEVEAEPVVEVEADPVVEVEADPVVEPEAEEPVEDGPVTIKSVETVSAIDLIMGGADEGGADESADEGGADDGQNGADEPQEPASA